MLKEDDLNGMLRRYEDNQKKHQVTEEFKHDQFDSTKHESGFPR